MRQVSRLEIAPTSSRPRPSITRPATPRTRVRVPPATSSSNRYFITSASTAPNAATTSVMAMMAQTFPRNGRTNGMARRIWPGHVRLNRYCIRLPCPRQRCSAPVAPQAANVSATRGLRSGCDSGEGGSDARKRDPRERGDDRPDQTRRYSTPALASRWPCALAGAATRGSRTRNVAPAPVRLSAVMVPPCASTIWRAMARPRPAPARRALPTW